jgi:DNA processing protein
MRTSADGSITERLRTLAAELDIAAADRAAVVAHALQRAASLQADAVARGFDLLVLAGSAYPALLAATADPPPVLWAQGPADLDGPSVAIVGSRAATPAGLGVARELSRDLARRGYTIVSGLAAGVDGAAHEAALDADGATVAVLGTSLDFTYPARHRALQAAIAERGRLLSEFAPPSPPEPWHFPRRNRIIAGLVRAVIVIEASAKSGSLITARLALEQGREVLAVPGSVLARRSSGCHALIRDGARLVESVDDVLEELEGIGAAGQARGEAENKSLFHSDLEAVMVKAEIFSVDDLAERTGRTVPEILAELAHLEIEGRVTRAAGGWHRN